MRGTPARTSASTASTIGVSSGGGAVAFPINKVISPFTESRAASCARISAAVPRRNSSCNLGQFPRHHHGTRSQRFLDGFQRLQNPVRSLVENQRRRARPPAPSSAFSRCPGFGGRNPPKWNESVGRPDAASAVSAADAPGIG